MTNKPFISMRMFYLANKKDDSCSYFAFTKKMNRLYKELGDDSGIVKMSPTLFLIDIQKTNAYLKLIQKSTNTVQSIINELNGR
jgi:hypothetical protein